MPKTHEVKA